MAKCKKETGFRILYIEDAATHNHEKESAFRSLNKDLKNLVDPMLKSGQSVPKILFQSQSINPDCKVTGKVLHNYKQKHRQLFLDVKRI